jgi:hypothetical protein
MARVVVALMVFACVSAPSLAAADECSCCNCSGADLSPPPPPTPPGVEPELVPGPSEGELEGALAGGITALAASYVLGVLVAWHEPHTNVVVDRIPIVGPVASAARNSADDQNVPLLLFSAGVQAMSAMVIAAAATDLTTLRRIQVSVGAGPDGCGMTLSGHF